MRMAVGGIVLCLAGPASAQAPDYVGFMRAAEEFAEVMAILPLCEAHGFSVDQAFASGFAEGLTESGVEMGIDLELADSLIAEAVTRENRNMEYLIGQAAERDDAGKREFAGLIDRRCEAYAADQTWGRMID